MTARVASSTNIAWWRRFSAPTGRWPPRREIRASGVCGACQRRVRRLSASAGTLGVMTELAIEATRLAKSFGETKALAGVDLAVRQGNVLAVLGPNGAGKTNIGV